MNSNVQKVLDLAGLVKQNEETIRRLHEENKQHKETLASLVVTSKKTHRASKKIENKMVKRILGDLNKSGWGANQHNTTDDERMEIIKKHVKKPISVTQLKRVVHMKPTTLKRVLSMMQSKGMVKGITFDQKMRNGRILSIDGWVDAAA